MLIQEDYSQVELMASNKQKEAESLLEELAELRVSVISPELQVCAYKVLLYAAKVRSRYRRKYASGVCLLVHEFVHTVVGRRIWSLSCVGCKESRERNRT